MPLIPEEKIAEIRDRTDIVQVIGEYVALKRSGVNHKGLCPFHGEKTPSFNVNAAKQIYHCFGCGKSGDVIRFLMEHDGKQFLDVVRELAKRGGIDLPEPERSPAEQAARARAEGDRSRMLRVCQLACEFFRGEFAGPRGERGRAYVDKRGIGREVRESFLLGYAPPGWDGLVRFFESKKVPAELAERAGVIRARDGVKLAAGAPPSKATHFDLFRDRVMFPLISPLGEVIAFGGRTLEADDKVPKYINSPETLLYKKGDNLYGLHAAKAGIRKAGRAILVEGNFDVLMMHEKGLSETVAPMGTALTPTQCHLLHRYSPSRVFLFLDGDNAGLAAAARNVGTFLDEELLSYVALLPRGDDPDTFVQKNGRDAVEMLLSKALESVAYFCRYGWKKSGDSPIEAARLVDDAAPIIRKVKNEAARQRYAAELAQQVGLPAEAVWRQIRAGAREPERTVEKPAPAAAAPVEKRPAKLPPLDCELIALIADHPMLLQRLKVSGALRAIGDPALQKALAELAAREGTFKFDSSALADALDREVRAQVMEAAMSGRYADVADPEKALAGLLRKFETAGVLAELKRALTDARAAGEPDEIARLNAKITELNQQRMGLKG